MPTRTTRDRIWLHVLNETVRKGNVVDARSVASETDCSARVARDVLKVMDRVSLT